MSEQRKKRPRDEGQLADKRSQAELNSALLTAISSIQDIILHGDTDEICAKNKLFEEEVEKLLKKGANPNAITTETDDIYKSSALRCAVINNSPKAITSLIRAKANIRDEEAELIDCAIQLEHPTILYVLLKANAHISYANPNFAAPENLKLHESTQSVSSDGRKHLLPILQWGINKQEAKKQTTSFLAGLHARAGSPSTLMQASRSTIFDWQSLRPPLNLSTKASTTSEANILLMLLSRAISRSKKEEVQWLLTQVDGLKKAGFNIVFADSTLLMYCIYFWQGGSISQRQKDILEEIMERTDVNPPHPKYNFTPLMFAVQSKADLYIVQKILNKMEPITPEKMQPIIDVAKGQSRFEVVQLLEKAAQHQQRAAKAPLPTAALLAQFSSSISTSPSGTRSAMTATTGLSLTEQTMTSESPSIGLK